MAIGSTTNVRRKLIVLQFLIRCLHCGTRHLGAALPTTVKLPQALLCSIPGVYCGGLNVSGTANVTFNPGTYVFKDGFFFVGNSAVVKGTDTGFYLTGKNSLLWFVGTARSI